MSNIFDRMAQHAFEATGRVFGYDAQWVPANGSEIQAARVLFREPTNKEVMGEVAYSPLNYMMEYHSSVFPGLFESVETRNEEHVIVNGKSYIVRDVRKKHDGHTLIAVLEIDKQ